MELQKCCLKTLCHLITNVLYPHKSIFKGNYRAFLLFLFTLSACSTDTTVQDSSEKREIHTDSINSMAYVEDTIQESANLEPEFTTIHAARIGTYQELAILVLKWYPLDDNGIHPIDGHYFYAKHQKRLELEGYSEPRTRRIYLTESYKGKKTGYIEFTQDDFENESFWAPNKQSKDRQDFKCYDLDSGEPLEMTVALNHEKYQDKHEVTGLGEPGQYETVMNELLVTRINDEYLAFYISVIGDYAHLGTVQGVARIEGDQAIFDNRDKLNDGCELNFDLSEKNKIKVKEVDCRDFHGARVTFDGVFTRK